MYDRVVTVAVIAAGLLVGACRTPVLPTVRPVANLYPTLNAADVLDEVAPVNLSDVDVRALLEHARLWAELEAFGLSKVELMTAARGLQRRGYAEIDARRSDCPVRWVVFMPKIFDGRRVLYLEAGLWRRPSLALDEGLDLSVPPEEMTREDIYGRTYRLLVWVGVVDDVPVAIRHVFNERGKPLHWELACRYPLGNED